MRIPHRIAKLVNYTQMRVDTIDSIAHKLY